MKRLSNIFKTIFNDPDSGVFRQIPLNIPGKLYISPMPFGAYDRGSHLLNIYKKNKIDHAFILVTDNELKKKARRDLLKEYSKNNITYSRFEIKDLQTPSLEVIRALVSEATERLKKQHVIIHCHAGVGRTAVSVCCVTIAIENFSVEEAIDYVRNYMTINMTSEQKNLIKKYKAMM